MMRSDNRQIISSADNDDSRYKHPDGRIDLHRDTRVLCTAMVEDMYLLEEAGKAG